MQAVEGKPAPDFALKDDEGRTVRLSELSGSNVVLYFYPKDDTPGCTIEACDFRDSMARLQKEGTVVLGVSPDGEESHRRFKEKFDLPFQLLVDADHAVADAYGAWGEKKTFGITHEGILRSTFLIGPDGTLHREWRNVRAKGHVDQVLEALEGLS
jgi:peroxiredoxin Q/BCP